MNTTSSIYPKVRNQKKTVVISIPKTQSIFQLVVEEGTRIHSIIIEVAKRLHVNHLQSDIRVYRKYDRTHLQPESTIHQNKVLDKETLTVEIKATDAGLSYYSKTHDFETAPEYHKYMSKRHITPGLTLEGMCVNPECVNYGKTKVIPLGTGFFKLNALLGAVKCPICPDRDKQTNPPLSVKRVALVSCYWRYEGDLVKKDGFPSRDFSRGWRKVEDFDFDCFAKLWNREKWTNLDLECRGL